MSEPILVLNDKAFNATAMTGNLTSKVYDISTLGGFCVHQIWTGTPVGNLLISASNDGINFDAINSQAAGGVAGQNLLNVERAHYCYIQVTYTFTSGTGSLTCYVSGKRI